MDQERRYRGDDGGEQSRSAVIQEALEMWLEVSANDDFERMTKLSDRIEATQDLIRQSTNRLAKMVYGAHLKAEMAYELLEHDYDVRREDVRGTAARILDAERRQS